LKLEYSKCGLPKLELSNLDFLEFELLKHGCLKVEISKHKKHDGLSHVKHY
jgi:hypothetical protein